MQSRPILTGWRDCFTGLIPSQKQGNDYRLIGYEGVLERDFIILLEDDDEVISFNEQDRPVRWKDGNKWRRYTPDFGLVFANRRRVGVEVKPLDHVIKRNLLPSFKAIRRAAISQGVYDDFQLWTDREIRASNDLRNAEFKFSERHQHHSSQEGIHLRTAFAHLNGRASVAELRLASGLGDRVYRASLRMAAEGNCILENPSELFEDHSIVVWRHA